MVTIARTRWQLLEQLDTTNDGFIDVNEFLQRWWTGRRSAVGEIPTGQAAFDMLDKDGNGTIDAEEVAELVFMNDDDDEGRTLTTEARKLSRRASKTDTDATSTLASS